MFEAYKAAGLKYVYIDLGYWDRKRARSDYGGNHKVVVNSRHATEYFRKTQHPDDRLKGAPEIQSWQKDGGHIVIAGLSGKGAIAAGLRPLSWEYEIINRIRQVTKRPIIYRPKPSWKDAHSIPGTTFSPGEQPIAEVLTGAHLLATLSSNAALDALAAGVPIHAVEGLASVMSTPLEQIENPWRPDDREQFFADVSYSHWRRDEIASGDVFDRFRAEGLL